MTVSDGTALVTGAASGIGKAVALRLAQEGRHVLLVDRDADGLHRLSESIAAEATPFVVDLADDASVDRFLERISGDGIAPEILVNCAGHDRGGRKPLHKGLADDWRYVVQVNLIGLMRLTRGIVGGMVERGRGHIVNLGSVAGIRIVADMAAYSASKAGVHMLSDILRAELAETPIRVTEILPGLTRTGIILDRYRGDPELERKYYDEFQMALEAGDVAECVMFAVQQPAHVQVAQLVVLPTNRW